MAMTAKELAVIGIRLLAIFLAIQGVVVLPQIFLPGVNWEGFLEEFPLYFIGGVGAPFLLGLILWVVAYPVARKMIGIPNQTDRDSCVTGFEIQAMVISTAGFLLVMTTFPSFVSQLVYCYNSSVVVSDLAGQQRVFVDGMTSALLASSLQLVLGLFLVTHSKLWARLLHWIRNVGLENTTSGPA